MEIFGAWVFLLGLVSLLIIFIIYLIVNIKYGNIFTSNPIFDIAMWCVQLVECYQYICVNMWGVSESREPIKGEFAKKLIEEMQRMLKLKKEGKDLHFENKDREIRHNIIKKDDI